MSGHTVDGSEFWQAPVDMARIPVFKGFIYLNWLAGFLHKNRIINK